jgi:hypothetical protein
MPGKPWDATKNEELLILIISSYDIKLNYEKLGLHFGVTGNAMSKHISALKKKVASKKESLSGKSPPATPTNKSRKRKTVNEDDEGLENKKLVRREVKSMALLRPVGESAWDSGEE